MLTDMQLRDLLPIGKRTLQSMQIPPDRTVRQALDRLTAPGVYYPANKEKGV